MQVTVRRRIIKPEVIDFIAKADQTYQLTQRRTHRPRLLAQHDALTARNWPRRWSFHRSNRCPRGSSDRWNGKLVRSVGRTQATRYFIDPNCLRSLDFSASTTLKRIEPHRLTALVLEDLQRYPKSAISDIHKRVWREIHPKQVKRALEELIERGEVRLEVTTAAAVLGGGMTSLSDNLRSIVDRWVIEAGVRRQPPEEARISITQGEESRR